MAETPDVEDVTAEQLMYLLGLIIEQQGGVVSLTEAEIAESQVHDKYLQITRDVLTNQTIISLEKAEDSE